MRVFITGIGGFVGSRLARHLLERGDRVSGAYIGTVPSVSGVAGVDLHEVDLLDREALKRAIAAADPDAIVNLAGLSSIGGSWKAAAMPDYFWVNLVGTENLLAAAAGRKVIIASSADVYGEVPPEQQPISEDRPVSPRSPYALTKAASERLAFASGHAVVARSFNMIGPGQAPEFVLPSFALQLAAIARGENEPVLRVGNLTARRDFVHVDDGAEAYRLLAEKGEPGGVYNIATGQASSIDEILHRLMAISGVEARIEIDPEKFRKADLPLLTGDANRLQALGWAPSRTLDDAVRDLWKENHS
ncbi:MAG TPA: GDP-mannose 4,6-dehydratase [Thermoanaerobaculia bacterium]|jgi:GDP-4-dehydro-6-deoxy-D-mannose reductase|nr:GDP-mannose 4,6-dehydratase [Thermoanaerobaculia bacterium]